VYQLSGGMVVTHIYDAAWEQLCVTGGCSLLTRVCVYLHKPLLITLVISTVIAGNSYWGITG